MILFSLVTEANEDMERINKETGELSASGESLGSSELARDESQTDSERREDTKTRQEVVTAFKHHLVELDKATGEDREKHLVHLLPLFIQVTTQKMI